MSFKPLLAASLDGEEPAALPFPLLWSPKLDGIRTLMVDGATDKKDVFHPGVQPASRKIKQIPNNKIRALLSRPELAGLDGELISGTVTDADVFNFTTRIVMKGDGPGMGEVCWLGEDAKGKSAMSSTPVEGWTQIDQTSYFVFDDFSDLALGFDVRYFNLCKRVAALPEELRQFVVVVAHEIVDNVDDLMNVERIAVEQGYEGVMLRSREGRYKTGRSTFNECILVKMKRFQDTDGVIVGFEEMYHNDNEKVRDNLGHGKRSQNAEGMRAAGTLGALVVRLGEFGDQTVKCGSGYSAALKQEIWDNQADWLNTGVVLKYQPSGMKDLPRFPVFKGRRAD
jgi:DNA ligase-1